MNQIENQVTDEVDLEVCCDALLDAVQSGALRVAEIELGRFVEVLPDPEGESGVAINFCPFCGLSRPSAMREPGDSLPPPA